MALEKLRYKNSHFSKIGEKAHESSALELDSIINDNTIEVYTVEAGKLNQTIMK